MVVAESVERGDRLGSVLLPVVVHEGESLRYKLIRNVQVIVKDFKIYIKISNF